MTIEQILSELAARLPQRPLKPAEQEQILRLLEAYVLSDQGRVYSTVEQ